MNKHDCFSCCFMNWTDNMGGVCEYPLPSCVPKHRIVVGVWGQLNNNCYGIGYGIDESKVGVFYPEDNSVIEIKDCPCYSKE